MFNKISNLAKVPIKDKLYSEGAGEFFQHQIGNIFPLTFNSCSYQWYNIDNIFYLSSYET